MRDNDSLILESLYSSILLKESSDEEYLRLAQNAEENKEELQDIVSSSSKSKSHEYFYFENSFPEDVKNLILKNAHKLAKFVGIPRCHFEVARWYIFLIDDLKIDENRIKITRGYYSGGFSFYNDPEMEHYWLKIDNKIFDPTAWQFGKRIFRKKYISLASKKHPKEWANKNCQYKYLNA